MLTFDEFLIQRCIAKSGKDIHDVMTCISIYRNCTKNIKNDIERSRSRSIREVDRQYYLREKYERILVSFLVTGDIKDSKRFVESCFVYDEDVRYSC